MLQKEGNLLEAEAVEAEDVEFEIMCQNSDYKCKNYILRTFLHFPFVTSSPPTEFSMLEVEMRRI